MDTLAFVGGDGPHPGWSVCSGLFSVWGLCPDSKCSKGFGQKLYDIACAFVSVISRKWVVKARPDSRAGAAPLPEEVGRPHCRRACGVGDVVAAVCHSWLYSLGINEVAVNVPRILCVVVILVSGNMERRWVFAGFSTGQKNKMLNV